MQDLREIHIEIPNERILSRLRNGHRVRVMHGGALIFVKPKNHGKLIKAFLKNRGAHLELDEDEIAHNEGQGFFGAIKKGFQKAGSAIKNVAQKTGNAVVQVAKASAPALKDAGKWIADEASKHAGEIGASALSALALASGNPELVPLAATVGMKLGDVAGKKGAQIAKDKIDSINVGSGLLPLGNVGYLTRSALQNHIANAHLANIQALSSHLMENGQGLYGGTGLYAQPAYARRIQGRGMSLNRGNKNLINDVPQSFQSDPYFVDFRLSQTLPPAYQKYHRTI
jgi:hypothetical protein